VPPLPGFAPPHTLVAEVTTSADSPGGQDVFDPEFLSELEGLVAGSGMAVSSAQPSPRGLLGIRDGLAGFFAPVAPGGPPLDESTFVELGPAALNDLCNGLIESSRESPQREPAQAVESFAVFFQALVPTLGEESAREVKTTFFRLVPTLLQMAWHEPGPEQGGRDSGEALRLLETILLEVASVRLAPAESELLFKSLEQLATLVSAGEYALARDVVAMPLLGILRKNRVARSLFRLMQVEALLQADLKERFGYLTPQLRVPEDLARLAGFGPIRVFDEEGPDGVRQRYLQVQLPDIPILSDIVLHVSRDGDGLERNLRFDGLGSVAFDLAPGLYRLGLLYEPEGPRGLA
jgi:hypothetical protein